MKLSPGHFNRFYNKIGQDVLWRQASMCPCRNIDGGSGAPTLGCPFCDGRGVIWADPVQGVVAPTGMRVKREWASFGTWESGDELLGLPSDSPVYACGEKDRVTMINSSIPFQTVLVRGAPNEFLGYTVVEVDEVRWIADGQMIIGDLPDVDPDTGQLAWLEGAGPPANTQYSLRGRKRPEWFMYADMPKDRHMFHGLDLPRVCVFKRFDLFGRVYPPG